MSKRISDLHVAKASRVRNFAQRSQTDPQRPRLAERLVALAPLARAPLVPESVSDPQEPGLSRLADSHRFRPQAAIPGPVHSRNALVPRSATPLPQIQEPVRLSRVSDAPLGHTGHSARDGQGVAGFLIGLSMATAIGVALYAYLT